MEFLEKIPYLLSLFAPIAIFFAFGLWIAWWLWYRHADRLQVAYTNNLELGKQIEAGRKDERDLTARTLALISTQEANWGSLLSDKDSELEGLKNSYSQMDSLQSDLSKRDDELEALRLDLSSRDNELDKLRAELTANKNASLKLETEIDETQKKTLGFSSQISGKEDELKVANSKIASYESKIKETETELQQLRSETTDTSELEAIKISLRDAEAALESERNSASQCSSGLALFEGESVTEDASLGFVYNNKPSEIDDLKEISGVAEVLEGKLNDFGVYRYKQIALWQKHQIDEFGERLNFSDRIHRDMWVHQAVDLHFDKYDEHLSPQVNIYHKPKHDNAAKEKTTLAVDPDFAGEEVQVDEKLGLVFTQKPNEIDDLKRIKGVANVLEKKLHDFGVYRFKQIFIWNEAQIAEFSERLSFPGRIARDNWKQQAQDFHNEKYT